MTADDDYAEDLRAWYAEDDPDGAMLLDDVEAFIRCFCVLPGEHCYVGVSLWPRIRTSLNGWRPRPPRVPVPGARVRQDQGLGSAGRAVREPVDGP